VKSLPDSPARDWVASLRLDPRCQEAMTRRAFDVSLPDHWSSLALSEFGDMVGTSELVDAGDAVRDAVQHLFDVLTRPKFIGVGKDGNGMTHRGFRVLKVSRNKNRKVFERYVQCIRRMATSCEPSSGAVRWSRKDNASSSWRPSGDPIEGDVVRAIQKQGFDPRMARAGMLGHGIYCAERPCKSDRYSLRSSSIPDSSSVGERSQMLLCRVALGQSYATDEPMRGLRRPPCVEGHLDGLPCDHDRLDSVVWVKPKKYREFVVFDGSQIFPEFVVEYERVSVAKPLR